MIETKELTPFEAAVLEVIDSLLKECPLEAASVEFTVQNQDESFITVVPKCEQAACIHLHLARDGAYADFDFGNSFSNRELGGEGILEELRKLSQAVIQGRCGETKGWISRTSWFEHIGSKRRAKSSAFFYVSLWPHGHTFQPYCG